FKEPNGRRFLLVERGGVPNGDPLTDSRSIESQFVKTHGGYSRIRLERVAYRDFNTADWEFTWRPSGGLLHVLDRNIVNGATNRAYAVYWSVPDEDWTASKPALQHILSTFTPRD
ncbi:MAG: serine/threonine protein kinase, partial [Frankiales bacterium]|nr:serine/threonine protein kinase [Frankiales bacterium]